MFCEENVERWKQIVMIKVIKSIGKINGVPAGNDAF